MKKTNKEMYVVLLSVVANSALSADEKTELTDFINIKLEQLEKKANSVSKKQAEKAAADEKLADVIYSCLATVGVPLKVSDLIRHSSVLSEYSTQKLTPILSKMYANGKVEKEVLKRETFYTIAKNID